MTERIPIGGVVLVQAIIFDLETAAVPDPLPTVTVRVFGPDAVTEIAAVVMEDAGPTTAAQWDAGLPRDEQYVARYQVPPTDAAGARYTRFEIDVGGEYSDRGFVEHTFSVKR